MNQINGESAVKRGTISHWFSKIFEREGSLPHCFLVLLFYLSLFTLFFSPALVSGHLLAPGDGPPVFLPNFFSHKELWDTLLFGGFPMVGDPQVMRWYPPELLSSLIPGSWNLFIIAAYVAASSFTYGYVYTLTRSKLAAGASGIIYGMSGFMMAHLGHTVIIHSAAWIPLIVWSFEKLRNAWSPGWFIAGSLGVTLCFLGGHSQIFFYALMLATSYAALLGWTAPAGRWRYYGFVSLLIIFGIGLAALQIIPTAELVNQSVRTDYSFAEFVSYSLPPRQLITLIFPSLFGLSNHPTNIYFGDWNLTELTGYIGLMPLMLAALAIVAKPRNTLTIFWLCAGALALLLTLGGSTPLATLFYHIPIINHFRAPARHFIEFSFAISVLAGLGVAAVLRGALARPTVLRTVLISASVMLACLIGVLLFSRQLRALAAEKDVTQLSLLPWENRALFVPLAVFIAAASLLLYWQRAPASALRAALFISVLLVDLGSFGWFYEWRYASPDKGSISPPVTAAHYRELLNAGNQRLLPVRGMHGSKSEFPPNTSRLWGIASASGVNVLRLARTSRLLSMTEGGDVDPTWKDADNRSLDVMAVRYVFLPPDEAGVKTGGISWLKEDLGLWLGSGCDRPRVDSLNFSLPSPIKADTVGIVSRLACSVGVKDRSAVLRVTISEIDGGVYTKTMDAGLDTSEWAYDCGSVRPNMKHGRATVFSDYPAQMYDEPCTGHLYVTKLSLDGVKEINGIQFEWVGSEGAAIIEKVSLVDAATKSSSPVNLTLLDNNHWRYAGSSGESRVFENLRAMPRAWLAPEAVSVAPEEALKIIKSSTMPDGRIFDPSKTALIEGGSALRNESDGSSTSAQVTQLSATAMDVSTDSSSPSFLMTSDPYYPGWQATLDGESVPVLRADYAIRAVFVPEGKHLIHFEFRPKSFYLGLAVSFISLLGLLIFASKFKFNGISAKNISSH